jgi:hypothetical protein
MQNLEGQQKEHCCLPLSFDDYVLRFLLLLMIRIFPALDPKESSIVSQEPGKPGRTIQPFTYASI